MMPRGFMPNHRHGAETWHQHTLAAARFSDTGVMSFLDRGETERALGRRLIGDISAGAMETCHMFAPWGDSSRSETTVFSHRPLLMLLPSLLVPSSAGGLVGLNLRAWSEHRPQYTDWVRSAAFEPALRDGIQAWCLTSLSVPAVSLTPA